MDYQRQWLEESGSDDSHGRVSWALGTVLGRSNKPTLHNMAGRIFEQSLLGILKTTSPRAWAFALIGIHEYLGRFAGDRRASQVREELAGRLLALYRNNRSDEWHWFEQSLTYCNAALPHAMLLCGDSIPNTEMTEAGLELLRWLAGLQRRIRMDVILSPSAPTVFIRGAANAPASTSNLWKHKPWSPLASRPTGLQANKIGAKKRGAPSNGSLGAMI